MAKQISSNPVKQFNNRGDGKYSTRMEVEERMRILANLIIDKILEDKKQGVLHSDAKFSNLDYGTRYGN